MFELDAEEKVETDPRLANAGFLMKKICFRTQVPEKYILSYKTPFKQYWDLIILVLAVYNSIMIPVEQCYKPRFLQSSGMSALNLLIDFIFLVDIILMFFTSVINFRGRESYDSNLISTLYVSQFRFYTDVLSMLGAGPIVD